MKYYINEILYELAELIFDTVTCGKYMGIKIIVASIGDCTSSFYLSDDDPHCILIFRSDRLPAFLDLLPIDLSNPNFDPREWFEKQNIIEKG